MLKLNAVSVQTYDRHCLQRISFQSIPIPLCLPVGCVHIKTFTQINKTFRYLARFHAGVDQLLQQHRVEFVNLFNVGKEYLQFVQAQTGALLPIVQIARQREIQKGERKPQLACKNCRSPPHLPLNNLTKILNVAALRVDNLKAGAFQHTHCSRVGSMMMMMVM